jgi:hypothetical protein
MHLKYPPISGKYLVELMNIFIKKAKRNRNIQNNNSLKLSFFAKKKIEITTQQKIRLDISDKRYINISFVVKNPLPALVL